MNSPLKFVKIFPLSFPFPIFLPLLLTSFRGSLVMSSVVFSPTFHYGTWNVPFFFRSNSPFSVVSPVLHHNRRRTFPFFNFFDFFFFFFRTMSSGRFLFLNGSFFRWRWIYSFFPKTVFGRNLVVGGLLT